MFAIAFKQEQYRTYILSDQKTLSRLEIVPERGGIVTRWQIQGQNILYLDAQRFANPQLSIRGGIPILFPICGNLPDNIYTYKGKQYTLKQHGFARDLPWEVAEQSTDNNSASLTLLLKSNEQTRAVYPFDFQLAFTYQLQENRLRIEQYFTNRSDEVMPFSTGLHPYFYAGDKTQLTFDIPASQYQDQQSQEIYPFSGTFDFNQDEIDVAFKSLTHHSTSLTDNQRRLKIAINYSALYSTLVFWTVKGKNYVCLEPWSAPRNALNTGEQLNYLEPGSTYQADVEIAVSYF
ncbi:MAG: aldose epimerase [Hydrococcus sp. C42_A2020_068]|uniref:aldose epimerase family protein n=1 Tax=Pleurocapsa sp. PCC 7327 TaxID=118163 RepID=UPI00029F8BA0|nr:galactose mutarotase [Pleurocapsa sp. PCC 7327]AFY77038.1 galactose mutarotase-like enzyme [Pleurocapsa sp. PCC 7327]MBF2022412.1 aldose epimerase [Hydrococcus sp. C42_A2020_068]